MPPRNEQTPTKPKVPTKLAPENAAAIREWHNTPLYQRLQTLQSGKNIPGFINPGSVDARQDYLERMIARQSQQKDPLTPGNQPQTPTRPGATAGGTPEIAQLLSMLAGGEQTNPENPDRDTTDIPTVDNPYPVPVPTPDPPPPVPVAPPVAPSNVSPEQQWTPADQQQYQDTQKWEQAVPTSGGDIVDTRWMPWEDSQEALERARLQSVIEGMLQGPGDPFAPEPDPFAEIMASLQNYQYDPFTMIRMGLSVDPNQRVPFHHQGMPDRGSAANGGRFPWMYEDYGADYGPGGEGRYGRDWSGPLVGGVG